MCSCLPSARFRRCVIIDKADQALIRVLLFYIPTGNLAIMGHPKTQVLVSCDLSLI